jgi:hypothetical protein
MDEDKGQWAEVADEGIAPTDDDDGTTGRTTGDDTPATAEGIDLSAGDDADATTDGNNDPTPEGVEPDLRDATKPFGGAQRDIAP